MPGEYDIIEDERQILLAKGKALPIKLHSEYAVLETRQKVVYTDEEMIGLASRAHESALLSYLHGGELVSIRTTANFTEQGYTVRSQICMLKEIGESVPLTP